MKDSHSFFRGQELPRLLVLLSILIVGMVFFWRYLYFKDLPAAEPEPAVVAPPVPVARDQAIEYDSVTDKTKLGLRDMAAYKMLLERAHDKTPVALARESRRDLFFTHLWERPNEYRGVPVHLLGTARRVLRYETKLTKSGWIHEAWIITTDSQSHPYCCVFEDAPKGFPIGPNVSERVVFDGYFLKLMAYEAGDVPRASPLLIGRLGWTAPPPAAKENVANGPLRWMLILLGVMFVLSFLRWMSGLRRSLSPRIKYHDPDRPHPIEEISPDALNAWVESVPTEGDDEHHEHDH